MPNEPIISTNRGAESGESASRNERLRGRTLILASDASAAAASAARVTAALAEARGALPRAVRVLDVSAYPVPAPIPYVMALADALVGEHAHAEHARAVREELAAALGGPPNWLVQIEFGTTAPILIRTARELEAALVVMGLRRHGPIDRIARDETTLHVMGESHCPVLGVVRGLDTLPRQIVVGMDFGRASVQAALAALDVIGDGGTLVLAYAQPPRGTEREDEEGARLLHTLGSDAAFGRVREELLAAVSGRYVEIEPVMVDRPDAGPGEAAKALLALAEQRGAEVIAVGSRRHGRLDRIMLGSVTTTLARHGERSLLVVPPAPAA